MNLWTFVQNKLKEKIRIAHEYHRVPKVDSKKYFLGIILTAVGWILIAQYTSLLEKVDDNQSMGLASQLSKFGLLMLIIHLTMVCVFSLFVFIGKKQYSRCENLSGVLLRASGSFISFFTFSLAKIATESIDNTILYSLDSLWIILIMAYVGIQIPKSQKLMIFVGLLTLLLVFKEDLSNHSILSWVCGTISGQMLAVITLMTTYLIQKDPPLRIGFYSGIIGGIGSLIVFLIASFFSGFPTVSAFEVFSMIYSGIIFSISLFCFLEAFYYTEAYIISVTSLIFPIFIIWNGWLLDISKFTIKSLIGTSFVVLLTLYIFFVEYFESRNHEHLIDGAKVQEEKK